MARKRKVAVYVLECEDEAWYVGVAEDPYHRFSQHQGRGGAQYTKIYRPLRIAHMFWCKNREEAEHLENAMTYVMQQMYLKVAGGRWSMPSPSGRGKEWTTADLAFRQCIHTHFGWTKTPQLKKLPKKKAKKSVEVVQQDPPRQALVSDIRKMAYSATITSDIASLLQYYRPKKKQPLSSKEIVARWKRKCNIKDTQ